MTNHHFLPQGHYSIFRSNLATWWNTYGLHGSTSRSPPGCREDVTRNKVRYRYNYELLLSFLFVFQSHDKPRLPCHLPPHRPVNCYSYSRQSSPLNLYHAYIVSYLTCSAILQCFFSFLQLSVSHYIKYSIRFIFYSLSIPFFSFSAAMAHLYTWSTFF